MPACTTTAPARSLAMAANAASISSGARTIATGAISTLVVRPASWTCSRIDRVNGSTGQWLERYATPGAEAEFYARFSGGPVAFIRPGQPVAPAAPKPPEAIEPPENLQ